MAYLILALALLSSAADARVRETEAQDFLKLSHRFAHQARVHAPKMQFPKHVLKSIVFKVVDGFPQKRQIGECQMGGGLDPTIRLKGREWDWADEWEREVLLFHELAHCVLNRPHLDGTIVRHGQRIPKSVMSTLKIDRETYILNRDYYLDELFSVLLPARQTVFIDEVYVYIPVEND